MLRFFLPVCVLVAILSFPANAMAQVQVRGCDLGAFMDAERTVTEGPEGSTRLELRGNGGQPIEIRCDEVLLIAQEIDYLLPEERLIARGQVVFQQTGTRIAAEHGEFDVKTRLGFFETASGTLQLTDREIDHSLFGNQEPEAIFSASRIEKTGRQTYKLTNAIFTACVQPSRRWEMTASRLTFTVDKYAILRNAVLQVKDVPLLYLPVFYFPLQEDGRATGFLMPGYGSSSYRGFSLNNAFFLAMGRSQDATIYHDWFMSRGHGLGADYRFVAGPSSRGDAKVYMFQQKAEVDPDGTVTAAAQRSFDIRGNLTQTLPGNIRLQGQANYFTDARSIQLYQTSLTQIAQRQRSVSFNASGAWGRLRATAQASRGDVFYGTNAATSNRTLPRLTASLSDATLPGTKIYFGAQTELVNLVRVYNIQNPDDRIGFMRTDSLVRLRAPVSLGSALDLEGRISLRRTRWNKRRDPDTGATVETPLTRTILETQARMVGPRFTRVFNTPDNGFAERFKHVIEPSITVKRSSAFDAFEEVLHLDSVDTVIGGVTTVTYSLNNRLLARVRQGDSPSMVREILNVDISQTYYTDALAASYDLQYQSSFGNLYSYRTPPSKLSPVRATVGITPTPALSGGFTIEYDTQFKAIRSYRASTRATTSRMNLSASWSKRSIIEGLPGFNDPLRADQFVSGTIGFKRPEGGAQVAYTMNYDVLRNRVLQQRLTGYYNAQCCGIAVDYGVTNLSHLGIRDDRRFSFSFTLAGLGSFTNLLGLFGDNGEQR